MIFEFTKDFFPMCSIKTIKESERAATILCDYLNKITDSKFCLNNISYKNNEVNFFLTDKYGNSGFSYEVIKHNLYFCAKNEQAFVYAVYDFLERVVGCRYYTSEVEYIPRNPNLKVNVDFYSFEPKLFYREVFYKDFENKAFSEKLKMSPSSKHEGWGFWCHSFKDLLPNKEYFKEHPEYFALIDGKRQSNGEPCLSNPEVKKIMIQNLKKFMDEHPECDYWSVSQNDDNLYCRCPECAKRDELDGGPMGSILNFVNDVAKEFPKKTISTLAYWYSRKPPKVTRPLENVHIMLCNIEANRGLPIETDERNLGTKEELLKWAKICGNVSLWDYCIQFANLVSPFPNLRVIGPNIRFFVENNVKLLFSQCNREIGGEFSELRGYMLAKLMWDPYCDEMEVMKEFCEGYYGKAAPYVLEYINLMHDALESTGGKLNIFGSPEDEKDTFLTEELYEKYENLFLQGEKAIANDEDLLFRLKVAKLPLLYAGIVLKYGSYEKNLHMIKELAEVGRKRNLHMVEEWKITLDNFVTDSLAQL